MMFWGEATKRRNKKNVILIDNMKNQIDSERESSPSRSWDGEFNSKKQNRKRNEIIIKKTSFFTCIHFLF